MSNFKEQFLQLGEIIDNEFSDVQGQILTAYSQIDALNRKNDLMANTLEAISSMCLTLAQQLRN